MCTDCEDNRRPDITLRTADIVLIPHSAAANAFLARKFAQVEDDLVLRDVLRIVTQARALGFVVKVLS